MKISTPIIFCINLLILSIPGTYALEAYPVCFWELVNQDRYIYPSDLEQMNWKMIRKLRQNNGKANSEKKYMKLSFLDGAASIDNSIFSYLTGGGISDSTTAVIRDPDGKIKTLQWESDELGKIEIPADNNLIGRYLVGSHMILKKNSDDGTSELIHLCAKHLVSHYKNGGRVGSESVVFLDDTEHMPFEIGPVINTAESRFGGGQQISHRSYEMMLKYNGKPIPGAVVKVIAMGSKWEKSFITDAMGKFEIILPDDRLANGEWQNYLYIATHRDQIRNELYITSFPVVVYRNRPEWQSKSMGFIYWAISGVAISLVIAAGFAGRTYWHNRRKMIIFENYKIKK